MTRFYHNLLSQIRTSHPAHSAVDDAEGSLTNDIIDVEKIT